MPTYDYVCDGCDHAFELFQGIKENAKRKCPECGKQKLRRLFGAGAAIVFKGSGFYQTDYRSEGYKKRAEADRKSAEGGSGDGKSKSDGSTKSDSSPKKESTSKSESKNKSKE